MHAYREMPDADLFTEEWVRVPLDAKEFPGYKGERVSCAECGEGISYERWVECNSRKLCKGCAEPAARYYQPLEPEAATKELEEVAVPRCACP